MYAPGANVLTQSHTNDKMLLSAGKAAINWGSLDDVVMGGVSESGLYFSPATQHSPNVASTAKGSEPAQNGATPSRKGARAPAGDDQSSRDAMVFSGVVSEANNGGFASVRSRNFNPEKDLGGYEGLRVCDCCGCLVLTCAVRSKPRIAHHLPCLELLVHVHVRVAPAASQVSIKLRRIGSTLQSSLQMWLLVWLQVTLRGDGQRYKLILRTSGAWDSMSYCASIDPPVRPGASFIRTAAAQVLHVFSAA